MSHRKIIVINDLHLPWHDPKAIEIVLDVAKQEQVDEIILNGDVADMYGASRYPANSLNMQTTLEDELNTIKEFLTGLRKMFPDQKIMFIQGNHEARLDKFIIEKCPELWNLFTLKIFCDFEKLKIESIPYNSAYQVGKSNLFVQHSPPSYGENGARTSLLKKVE